MDVILLEDVDKVGLRGDVVSVARGYARNFLFPRRLAEVASDARVAELKKRDEPWYVLGGGSNLLVSSAGVQGTVIRTAQLINMSNPEPEVVEADAGARLPHVAKFAASRGHIGV